MSAAPYCPVENFPIHHNYDRFSTKSQVVLSIARFLGMSRLFRYATLRFPAFLNSRSNFRSASFVAVAVGLM